MRPDWLQKGFRVRKVNKRDLNLKTITPQIKPEAAAMLDEMVDVLTNMRGQKASQGSALNDILINFGKKQISLWQQQSPEPPEMEEGAAAPRRYMDRADRARSSRRSGHHKGKPQALVS